MRLAVAACVQAARWLLRAQPVQRVTGALVLRGMAQQARAGAARRGGVREDRASAPQQASPARLPSADTALARSALYRSVQDGRMSDALAQLSRLAQLGSVREVEVGVVLKSVGDWLKYGKADGRRVSLDVLNSIVASVPRWRVAWNEQIVTCVLKAYGAAGQLRAAHEFFTRVVDRGRAAVTVAVYTAMMDVYAAMGEAHAVDQLLTRMRTVGLEPNAVTMGVLVKAHCTQYELSGREVDLVAARARFDEALHLGLIDEHMFPLVVRALCKAGKLEDAEHVIRAMEWHLGAASTLSYTPMMQAFASLGKLDAVRSLIRQMQERNVKLSPGTFNAAIAAFLQSGHVAHAKALLPLMRTAGIVPDERTYQPFLVHLSFAGKFDQCDEMLADMERVGVTPTAPSYHALMQGHAALGHIGAVGSVVDRMRVRSVHRTSRTYAILLSAMCGQLGVQHTATPEEVERVFEQMVADGVAPSVYTHCPVMEMALRTSNAPWSLSLARALLSSSATLSARAQLLIAEAIRRSQSRDDAVRLLSQTAQRVAPCAMFTVAPLLLRRGDVDGLSHFVTASLQHDRTRVAMAIVCMLYGLDPRILVSDDTFVMYDATPAREYVGRDAVLANDVLDTLVSRGALPVAFACRIAEHAQREGSAEAATASLDAVARVLSMRQTGGRVVIGAEIANELVDDVMRRLAPFCRADGITEVELADGGQAAAWRAAAKKHGVVLRVASRTQ